MRLYDKRIKKQKNIKDIGVTNVFFITQKYKFNCTIIEHPTLKEQNMRFFHYEAFPKNTVHGIFFHALADEFMGMDIPTMKEMEDIPIGETDVEIENQKGEVVTAICISWMSECNTQKGLIVLNWDSPSLQYARKLAAKKASVF